MIDILFGTPLYYAVVLLFGLVIGSFLNVVIYRLPLMLEAEWRSQCNELLGEIEESEPGYRFNLAWPPSRCPVCERAIGPFDNIPVLSYIALKGRCRGCSTRISARYPLVEILTGMLFVLVALHFGPTVQCLSGLLFTTFLITLAFIDIDHQLLPDNLTVPMLWAGLALSIWSVHVNAVDSIIGAIVGYLLLWSIFHIFRLATGKDGMGYGDFKLLAALGAWMGWQSLPSVILLASLVGAATGLASLATGRLQKEEPLPFGPFLASAGFITFLWGDLMMNTYYSMLGLA